LRHLDTVRNNVSADFIDEPLSRGYQFYLDRLFTENNLPKFTPDSLYPIDIHSCAEALLCISQLGPRLGGVQRLQQVFEFIQDKMLTPEGWYLAALRYRRGEQRPAYVPYMRWGQAWMLLAIARLHDCLMGTDSKETEPACASE
jgi:hypothetical protein